MVPDIRTIIIDPDPYSNLWINLIVSRDWRTKVVAKAQNLIGLPDLLVNVNTLPDYILLDTGVFNDQARKQTSIVDEVTSLSPASGIILIGREFHPGLLHQPEPAIQGYLIKSEICNSIAWALSFAAAGAWVCTPRA